MSAAGKIRVLLVLIAASLFFAAVIVKKTYSPVSTLKETGKKLEQNLQLKEADVNDLLNNKLSFERLKHLPENSSNALRLIQLFTADKSIWFITLNNNELRFWSGVKVIPVHTEAIKEGYSLIKEPNGYYEAVKKSEGGFSAIFFIPVKINYAFQNQYLQNQISSDLLTDNNIDIANVNDPGVYDIHSIDHSYLFSIKLKQGSINRSVFYYEISLWLLSLIVLFILVNNICAYIAEKGQLALALLVLTAFITLTRFINLHYRLPDFSQRLNLFNPSLYTSNVINPTIGDLFLNIIAICWLALFMYKYRLRLFKNVSGKTTGYFILSGCVVLLIVALTALLIVFDDLVVKSKINFDVSNVLNLSGFSLLGVLILCFGFLAIYFLIEICLTISAGLTLPALNKFFILFTGVVLATALFTWHHGFTVFYLLGNILVLVRAYAYRYRGGKLESGSFIIIIFICALISSIMLSHFESVKEEETRTAIIQKLKVVDDRVAKIFFKKIEGQILADTSLTDYFSNTLHNIEYIKTRLQKLYFNGYSSKYDFSVYEFDKNDQPLPEDRNYPLRIFKEMVMYNSFKISTYFYRENESFGLHNYFAILPVIKNNERTGTIVIELKSKAIPSFNAFPDLLVDNQSHSDDGFTGYSYAFYTDNRLINQNGSYVYDIENNEFRGKLNQYVFKTTGGNSSTWYGGLITYNHLIYKPSDRNLIVVSKKENPLFDIVTSVTFYFVIFLLFSAVVILARWLWLRIKIFNIKNNRIVWTIKIIPGFVLYKTRIQFSMILSVVVTLVAVGYITFYLINSQYQGQQDETIKYNLVRIAGAFENGHDYYKLLNVNEESQLNFNEFANKYAADLTLFDKNGVELLTTQPKIYDFGLLVRRMNARAYISLAKLKKSIFVNNETIGKLKYKACYMPLINSNNETIAYLQLPYFSNEADHNQRMGALLNIMINVYAVIFIAIGLFAIFIARQITAPLNFIQYSLSKTAYGKKNEPIQWDRNDEIGTLIAEYNKMIAALEDSALKLAQSERESAWREMAKQVAHEIKNPLTPLKLGLQLLDKSWRDKDPKFDQKFERFSKSFVEQIESLSSIASEFSAFAKMPDTRIERLNIFDILVQVVTIFKEMDNIKIIYRQPEVPFFINGDRDQLLRCFNNLLKNAIEATPPDRPGIIEINYTITSKNTLLTVKDNGNGIPENLREKIFEPNFTTKSSGTGLGLAFVKNSIENAGGKVWFETILGEGTTFYFSLPAA